MDAIANMRGRYELLGELAVGGMATVYLARLRGPLGFSRFVAVKHMHPHYAADPEFTSMFIDEARLTARLHHPNIVSTLDIVADDGQLLLVMEYIEGESLATLLGALMKEGGRMPVAIACALLCDTLLGLHEAHDATDDDGVPLAVVHRDVSPQNIMVGIDGHARVLDFGVAKAKRRLNDTTGEGVVKGKMRYMPPEQLFGEPIDRRADVYAAGVVLWELLCNRPLFAGPPQVIAAKVEEGVIPPPSMRAEGISPELDAIVLKALARDADDRFATAYEMAEAIARAVPLPRHTEIAAWVRRYVSPRAAASSRPGTLSPYLRDSSRNRIVAMLERTAPDAAAFAVRAESDSLVDVDSSATLSIPPVAPEHGVRALISAIGFNHVAIALGAAGLLLAGLAFTNAQRTRPTTATATPPPAAIETFTPDAGIVPGDAGPNFTTRTRNP